MHMHSTCSPRTDQALSVFHQPSTARIFNLRWPSDTLRPSAKAANAPPSFLRASVVSMAGWKAMLTLCPLHLPFALPANMYFCARPFSLPAEADLSAPLVLRLTLWWAFSSRMSMTTRGASELLQLVPLILHSFLLGSPSISIGLSLFLHVLLGRLHGFSTAK